MIKLQDKFKLRLKVLEEAVRAGASSNGVGAQRRPSRTNGFSRRGQLICGVDSARTLPSNGSGFELEMKSSVSTEATRKYSASSVNSLAEKETQDLADVDGSTNGSSDYETQNGSLSLSLKMDEMIRWKVGTWKSERSNSVFEL